VRARLDEVPEPDRLVLEVDPLHVGAGREAASVRHDELEALRERPLRRPRGVAVHDAPVNEQDARTAHECILPGARTWPEIASSGAIEVLQASPSPLVRSPC
jgi:hypothetical protein